MSSDLYQLGATVVLRFTTRSPTTGAATAADSTPTCDVFEDASDTPIHSPTPVAVAADAGHYRVALVLTTANGFELGKTYGVKLAATVGGIVDKTIRATFQLLPDIPIGSVTPDAGNSATAFETSRTEATNDYWKDALIRFYSGALAGQVKKISAYDGTTKIVTVASAFTGTPADGDLFMLVSY